VAVTLILTNIPDASAVTGWADGREMVRLGWTRPTGLDVMIVHRSTNAPAAPTQGQSYNVGDTFGGNGSRVIYKGSGANVEHVIIPGQTNHYAFYAINNNHYAPGVATNIATTAYPAGEIVDVFAYTNVGTLATSGHGGGGNGWTNSWTGDAGSFNIVSGSFSSISSYPTSAANKVRINSADVDGTSKVARRHFNAYTTGKVYAAYMLNYQYNGVNKYAGMSFMDGTTEKLFFGEGYNGDQRLAVGGNTTSSNLLAGFGNDYLVVGMYDFTADTGYVVAYKIGTDSVPSSEPSTWHGSHFDNTITRIDGIRLAAGAGSGNGTPGDTYFDEVRVATSWELLLANYAQPEIAVLGTNRVALTGGNTPDVGNGTDFGSALVAGGQVDRTLFITNSGEGALNISGVTTSGAHAADFVVVSWPTKVSPNAVSNLVLRFDPTAAGARTGTIEVASDDADESSYTFTVKGTGQVPPTVTTTIASATNLTTATAGGDVTADGFAPVTNRGVVWSLAAAPTAPGAQTTNGTGTGSFSSTLTNLAAGATYYYRAFAQNVAGTSYGTEYTLTTPCFSGVVTGLYASATNELNFTATWSNVVGASGYALDVSTDAGFGEGAGGNYGVEVFTNVGGGSSSSYLTRQWTNNGVAWTGYLARTDQTLDGAALTLQNANGSYLISQPITGGVDEIRVTHQLKFTGADSFDIFVNSIKVATNITYSSSIQTAVVQNIGVTGDFTIMITNYSGGRVALDNLTWSNTGSVASYVPGYSNRTVAGVSATVTGLTGDVTYYFRVRATNDYCATDNSATATVTTIAGVPAVPGGVVASDGTSLTEVSVIWSNVASEQGYSIWRHTANVFGSASQIGSTAVNVTNFSDTTATPGQLYYYWVTASNAVGSSAAGTSDTGYRQLAQVTGVAATDLDNTNNTQIVVTWTDVTGETGYGIWRNTVNASNTATYVGSAAANATGFADTTAGSYTTYYYWVRATNNTSASQGAWSASDDGYAGVREPIHLSGTATGIDAISLAFTQNVENSQVIIVYDLDGTFSAPSGAAPAVGAAFAGGIVVYKGAVSPQSHTGLAACTPYFYKAWSFDGTLYSLTSLTASATTEAPAAPTGLYVNPTNANNFTLNWSPSTGASGYRVDVSTNSAFGTLGTIRAQGFEAAVGDTWGFVTAGSVTTSTTRQRTGTYSLRLDGSGNPNVTFDPVALSGTSASTVTVAFSASGPDTDEDLFLSVCTYTAGVLSSNTIKLVDGLSNIDVAFNATNTSTVTTNPYSVAVSAAATQVYLVVYATGLEAGDYYYIDDISLSGQVGNFVSGYADRSVAGASVSVTGLLQNTLYYYRVRAEGALGCTGPNSVTGSVTTISSPIIGLSTNTLNFGTVPVGVSSNLTLVVTNSGYANVVVSAINLSGSCTNAYAVSPSAFTVSPGTASNVVVTFTPAVTGACSMTLTVNNNTPGDTAPTVSVTGTGYDPSSILAPTNVTAVADGAEMVVLGWTKVGGTPNVVVLWNSNAITATALTAGQPYNAGDSGPDGTIVAYHGSAAGGVEIVVGQKSTNYFRLFGGAGTLYSTNYVEPAGLPVETLRYEVGEIIDQFAYTNNKTLAENNLATGQGWSGGWTGDTNKYTVIDTNLLHGATGFPDPYANKLFWQDTSTFSADDARVTRLLGAARGGRIIVAFMMNYQYDGTEKYVGLSLMSGTNAATEEIFFGKLYGSIKAAGIEDPGASSTTTGSYDLEPGHGNDYMIVGELYPAQKTARMWAFYQGGGAIPQDYTNATPIAVYSNSSLSVSAITGIRLSAGSSGTANKELGHVYFDEVRVGGTWDEVLNFNYPEVYDYQVGTRVSGTNYVTDGALVEVGKTYDVSYTLYHRSGITNAQFTILDDVTGLGLYPTNVGLQFGANLAAGRQRYTNAVTNRLDFGDIELGTYTSRVFMTANSGRTTNSIIVAETGGASDLFFGEFGEGNNWDKYVEIYNGTGGAIDLSQYVLASQTLPGDKYVVWANWSQLSATTFWLDHGETIVLLNGGLNGAVSGSDTVDASMTNAMISANRPYLFTSNNVLNVSGDDPVALFRVSDTNNWVDVCGIGPSVARYIMRRVEDSEVPRSHPLQVDTNQWDYRDWDGDRPSGYTNFLATAGVYDRNVGLGGFITFQVVDDDTNAPVAGAMSMLLAGVPVTNSLTAPLLLAGWNFNDATNLAATSHGVGVMTDNLFTTNSSSGSSINLVDGDAAGGDLTMLGGTNAGRYIQFAVNMQYYQDLVVTFAAQRSGAGYNSNTIAYSVNGGSFVNIETNWNPDTSTALKTVDLSSVSAVDDATNVIVRITLGGGSGGNNRYDNFQFRAQRMVYGFTDGLLARVHSTNALHLGFRAYDTGSGVQRGTANDGVNMSVSLPGVITNNSSLYQSTFSSASTTGSAATSVWAFTSFSYAQIGALYGTGSNYVLISSTMADADHDRNNDRLWLSNQVHGVMHVTDDDPEPPVSVNVNLPGAAVAPFVVATNGTAPSEAIRGFIARRSGSGSNIVTSVTDHELANAGALDLQFYFGARDLHGLVQRGNVGDTNTVMSFSIGNVVSGNYADYDAGLSSAQASTNTTTTNAWSFSGAFAAGDVITALVTGAQQVVTLTIPDDDDDRPNDRGIAVSRQVGYLSVVDDDVKGPIIGSITPDKVYGSNTIVYTSFETSQGWPSGSLSSTSLWTNVTSQGTWYGNGVTYGTFNPKVSGTRRIGLLTNTIAAPWIQLPPVNDPGSLILFAGRFSGSDVTLRVERASGGTWVSVGSLVVTNVDPEFEAFTWDINVSGVTTLRVAHAGGPQVYMDDISVLPRSIWLSTNNLSLAWSEAVDDFSAVDEYRVVAPAVGSTRPIATNDGSYVSSAVTSQTFNITGQQGIITGFVFAVDNDNDRTADRAIGNLATVVVRIDTNPPPAVTNFVGSKDPGDVDDSTTQIKLTWNSRSTAAEAAGWRQSDNAPLSPFVSYRIYYAENQDRDLTYSDTYLDKDSDYTDLGAYSTAEVTLNDLVPGYTYSIAMAGVDEAGNVGPMSERVTITLDIFGITHAFANESSQTVIQWEGRDDGLYDVIYADSTGYAAQVDSLWKLAKTVVGTQFVDEGGADVGSNVERVAPRNLTPKWMRFYRVAPVNAWVPSATRAGAASEEIVVAHQVPLMQSNNFIGVSMSPMVDTVADFLGTNRLPGAASTMSESPRINFYTASTNGNADDNTLWLSRLNGTNRWLNQLSAPAGSDPLPYPYQGFSLYVPTATNLLMVGRVPWTNNEDMVKIEGQKYNVLSLNLPRPSKVSELDLRNLLTWGENIGSADEIRIMQKGTAPWGSPRARIYVWTNGLFYYPGANRQLAENFVIDADDAIIVYAKATPANVTNEVDWSATELAFYPVPGVQITNSFPAAPTVRALTSYVVDNTNGQLRGSVNPNNLATEFWFQYGTTTNYGTSTAKLVLPATNVPVVVSTNIYNLVPGATYYFRVMASNSLGLSRGGQGSIVVGSGPDNMAYIPAGSYTMGGNTNVFAEPAADELPQHNLSIGAFYMDRYEVTAQLWSNVYAWAVTNGYGFSTDGTGKGSSHPITSISWYDAVKWCNARSEMEGKPLVYYTSAGMTNAYRTGDLDIQSAWVNWTNRGYRLPTEAEWEKAARGGLADARFPWSGYTNRIAHAKANYSNDGAEAYAFGTTGQHPSYSAGADPDTSPVGSFGANGYGLYDMAGNADEFCWDWYSSSYYSSSPGTDPRGPVSGSVRVVRGGGYGDWAEALRVSARESGLGNSNLQRGFRTVLTP
jgi:formylglycine-generating enzyme required for sulfatase activity